MLITKKYTEYTALTLSGHHGSMTKLWMLYNELVQWTYIPTIQSRYRTNNLQLLIFTLSQMCPIFFVGNHPNYAHWMVYCYHNLMNIENTHPGVPESLEKGVYMWDEPTKIILRTQLEITVNADAASRLIEIARFGQSVSSARQRWMMTRAVISCMLLFYGHLCVQGRLNGLSNFQR